MLAELAGNEQVSEWAEALAQWMQQPNGNWVSLLQLQEVLGMQLVEVWLGLVLSNQQQYKWEQRGDFYSDAGQILLKQK